MPTPQPPEVPECDLADRLYPVCNALIWGAAAVLFFAVYW